MLLCIFNHNSTKWTPTSAHGLWTIFCHMHNEDKVLTGRGSDQAVAKQTGRVALCHRSYQHASKLFTCSSQISRHTLLHMDWRPSIHYPCLWKDFLECSALLVPNSHPGLTVHIWPSPLTSCPKTDPPAMPRCYPLLTLSLACTV